MNTHLGVGLGVIDVSSEFPGFLGLRLSMFAGGISFGYIIIVLTGSCLVQVVEFNYLFFSLSPVPVFHFYAFH